MLDSLTEEFHLQFESARSSQKTARQKALSEESEQSLLTDRIFSVYVPNELKAHNTDKNSLDRVFNSQSVGTL